MKIAISPECTELALDTMMAEVGAGVLPEMIARYARVLRRRGILPGTSR